MIDIFVVAGQKYELEKINDLSGGNFLMKAKKLFRWAEKFWLVILNDRRNDDEILIKEKRLALLLLIAVVVDAATIDEGCDDENCWR